MAKTTDGNVAADTAKPQDSTTKIPMVDLETAVKMVTDIREKALETATMPAVAKALGYANATSTPFYRRIAAARLFNLLSAKSSVTQEAIDYIRPHDEEMKARVLSGAIMGITCYADLVNRYADKKLNTVLVANAIAKDCKLTDACALVCARAFEASLRFAGMLSADGTVQAVQTSAPQKPGEEKLPKQKVVNPPPPDNRDTHEHVLFLDREKSRKFSFSGPLEISKAEYGRICKWLEFTMIIADEPKEPT